MNSFPSFLSRRFSSTLSMIPTNESTSRQTFHTHAVSRRDVVKTVVAGSFVAAALGSGVSPVLAEDIAQQMKALEKEFKDSVNSNGAPEKHIPKVSLSAFPGNPGLRMVEVVVPHVMDAEKPHFIQAIWLREEKTGDVAVAKVRKRIEDISGWLVNVSSFCRFSFSFSFRFRCCHRLSPRLLVSSVEHRRVPS